MTVALILVSIVVILVSIWYLQYYKYGRFLKKYLGPTPLPILGNALHFGSIKDILPKSVDFQHMYGPAVKMQIGIFPPFIQLTCPKLLESLLGSTRILDKGSDYRYLHRWLGTGLLTSGPVKWRKHRKILTPAFHFQVLDKFIDTFKVYADILVERMISEVGQLSVDIYPYITLCSLDIICATAMGTNVNAQSDGTSEYVKCVKEMSRIMMGRSISLISDIDWLYSFTSDYRAECRSVKVLHDYTNSVIASRKNELQKESSAEDEFYCGRKERRSFLDLLLQYKMDVGDITDEEIREEVDTFMFEGHDTTASALSFTLYSLANNPDVQNQAVKELCGIFGTDKKRNLTSKDLNDMKYLENVIKESLRLYPPVPLYARDIVKDTEFDGGILPKNITLAVFAYGVHRNPEIYPDPEKFDPERFTPELKAKRSPYAYIPFSAGPRNCIGQKFAMMEMKSVVSTVLRKFELLPATPAHKLVLVPEVVLKSSTGICICIKERL